MLETPSRHRVSPPTTRTVTWIVELLALSPRPEHLFYGSRLIAAWTGVARPHQVAPTHLSVPVGAKNKTRLGAREMT